MVVPLISIDPSISRTCDIDAAHEAGPHSEVSMSDMFYGTNTRSHAWVCIVENLGIVLLVIEHGDLRVCMRCICTREVLVIDSCL